MDDFKEPECWDENEVQIEDLEGHPPTRRSHHQQNGAISDPPTVVLAYR